MISKSRHEYLDDLIKEILGLEEAESQYLIENMNKNAGSTEEIMEMLDLFYANKHLYEKIVAFRERAGAV